MKSSALVGFVAIALTLGACGSGGLQDDDPKGFQACQQFEKARADGDVALEEMGAIGMAASEATTDGIRSAAKPMLDEESMKTLREANPNVEQIWLVDKDAFKTTCAEAGYKFS